MSEASNLGAANLTGTEKSGGSGINAPPIWEKPTVPPKRGKVMETIVTDIAKVCRRNPPAP